MNEHIKELIRQSGGLSYGDDNQELTPMLVGEGLEKFAEAIIKDIIDTALFQARSYQVKRQDYESVAICGLIDVIREDYGVD